ncbi:MAG: GNAT family N-acetyltransferase [Leifsonia flava]
MTADARLLPVDSESTAALATTGLRYGLVDTTDRAAFAAWDQADSRGFHEGRLSEQTIDANFANLAYRRTTGVWDDTIPDAAVPVATVSTWVAELTVPGPAIVPAWAVSSVTVAATHRRRGIARALMEGELRTAAAAGVPLAILTASEATIYGRYGYAPATTVATLEVDRRRVTWAGLTPTGRVHFVEPASARSIVEEISARAVRRIPGEIDRWGGRFDQHFGLIAPDSDRGRSIRTARYDDADGTAQGVVAFRLAEQEPDIIRLEVEHFTAATDDAYAGLWKFLLEHDLVTSIRARHRSVDEPLPLLLADRRAVRWSEVEDFLWVRVLDPITTLESRRYGSAGRLELEITDALGFAAGRFRLEVAADGSASVTRVSSVPDAAPDAGTDATAAATATLSLSVNQLGAIFLGGIRPTVLAAAGLIAADSPETLALADRLFAAERAPHLSIVF